MTSTRSTSRRIVLKTLATSLAAAGAPRAFSQAFPTRPIELVVPYPPGGATDNVARLLASKLGPILGQSVVIDNRGGASGNIAAAHVAKSAPDGHRLLMAATGILAINPHIFKNPGFDAFKDFAAVSQICNGAQVIAVSAQSNITSMQELVAAAKRDPKGLFYATPSAGTPQHLMGEMLADAAGIKLTPAHYKGVAQALTDVLGGALPIVFASYGICKPHADAGKLRILAVSTAKRIALAPQLPTFAETYPGYEMNVWFGIFAPAGAPATVIAKLQDAFMQVVASAEVQDLLNSQALPPVGGTATQMAQLLRHDYDTFGNVVRSKRITSE